MVHDLLVAVLRVRVHAMLPLVRGQAHPVHDHVQEPVQSQGDTSVPKQRLLASLALPLVDNTELEVGHQHVHVIVDLELAGQGMLPLDLEGG